MECNCTKWVASNITVWDSFGYCPFCGQPLVKELFDQWWDSVDERHRIGYEAPYDEIKEIFNTGVDYGKASNN